MLGKEAECTVDKSEVVACQTWSIKKIETLRVVIGVCCVGSETPENYAHTYTDFGAHNSINH